MRSKILFTFYRCLARLYNEKVHLVVPMQLILMYNVPIAVSTREQGNACLSSTTIILQHVYTMYNVIEATFGGNTNYNMQLA